MSGRRVTGARIPVNPEAVRGFFAQRERRAHSDHPLTSVLYQDSNPSLAEARDEAEKERLLPWLQLRPGVRLLDIACGIGRWATPVIDEGASYVGIDFANGLLEVARAREPRGTYLARDLSNLSQQEIRKLSRPHRVLIAGALIYLNDPVVTQLAVALAEGTNSECRIVLREPTGIEERLTLEQVESSELQTTYSAIYRTRVELLEQFGEPLLDMGYHLTTDEDLFDGDLNNRRETRQRFYVWDRQA